MARRKMTAAQRAEVSKRMKAFWRRRRREKRAPTQTGGKPPKLKDPHEARILKLALIGGAITLGEMVDLIEVIQKRLKVVG